MRGYEKAPRRRG